MRNFYIKGSKRTNRRRWFEKFHKGEMEAHSVERQAKNAPIQSTNADMIKEAIIEIDAYFNSLDVDCKIIGTVHDEVNFLVPIGREDIAEKVKDIMEEVGNRYLTNVKMESELTIDTKWVK